MQQQDLKVCVLLNARIPNAEKGVILAAFLAKQGASNKI
jgi:hypothetical protein